MESENRDSWEWFFRHLRRAIPTISVEECTLVSDRDKGLLAAEAALGPTVVAAHCCHHLKENFVEKHGRGLAPMFWAVARARTLDAYHAVLQKLRDVKVSAAEYLVAAAPETWAEALFRGRRYGHGTSNIVESVNRTLKLDRELPIVELLDAIWHRVMEHRADRLAAAIKQEKDGMLWTSYCAGIIQEGKRWAGGNKVSQIFLYFHYTNYYRCCHPHQRWLGLCSLIIGFTSLT